MKKITVWDYIGWKAKKWMFGWVEGKKINGWKEAIKNELNLV